MLVFANENFLTFSMFLVGKCMCRLCRARRHNKKSSRKKAEPTIKSKRIGTIYAQR